MRNIVLSYLLFPLLAGASLSSSASPASNASDSGAMVMVPMTVSPLAKLDLNKADAQTLQKELNGIGKAKAEAIVAYREAHGSFSSVEELLEIKGIGQALLDRNRDRLMVE